MELWPLANKALNKAIFKIQKLGTAAAIKFDKNREELCFFPLLTVCPSFVFFHRAAFVLLYEGLQDQYREGLLNKSLLEEYS